MLNKQTLYWVFQFFGWTGLFSLGLINKEITSEAVTKVLAVSFFGIGISHLIRLGILKWKTFELKFLKQFLFVIISSTFATLLFSSVRLLFFTIAYSTEFIFFDLLSLLNIAVYFVIWQIIYFTYILKERARQENLNNLSLSALNNEIELKNLRSQLNPHFIFNALNSIRALVDEDKQNAKKAINLLSNVMRSILLSEKQKLITVSDEMKLVNDYLALEKIRFEERLKIISEIEDGSKNELLPPLSIQTLIENAIKHGVSNRVDSSEIKIQIFNEAASFTIRVENDISDKKTVNFKSTNTGLNNLRKRLEIIYNNKATFTFEINEKAIAEIKIPKHHESNNY